MTEDTNQIRPIFPAPPRLIPFVILMAGLAAGYALGVQDFLSFDGLSDNRAALVSWRAENAVTASLVFMAVYFAAIAISLPGAIWLTIAGGFLFGTSGGALFAVIAATLGAAVIFLAARYAFAEFFQAKAGQAVKRMETGFNDNAFSYLLFLRLVPLFPFWLVNLVPALLNVRFRVFVIATFFGIIPGTVVFSSLGNGLGVIIEAGGAPDLAIIVNPRILGPIIGLAALSLVPVVYKVIKAKTAEK